MKFMKYSPKFTIILYQCHNYCHASYMELPCDIYTLYLIKLRNVYDDFINATNQKTIHKRFCTSPLPILPYHLIIFIQNFNTFTDV